MNKTILYFYVFLTLLSCRGEQHNSISINDGDENKIPEPTLTIPIEDSLKTQSNSEPTLTGFGNLPEEIDGCSCYFSETEELFEANLFFYATNMDSVGFIWIDEGWIKLKLQSTSREPLAFNDNDHVDIFSNEIYTVTADVKYKKSSGYETWINTGTITIGTNEEKIVKEFIGECGC